MPICIAAMGKFWVIPQLVGAQKLSEKDRYTASPVFQHSLAFAPRLNYHLESKQSPPSARLGLFRGIY